ncbi:MAG: DNA primase [Saprospiraceae bacterium]|nr:DNA primase [Saprospiraceae bacterium]
MISQKTIDTIFATVRIDEVVEDFVRLKKRGVNLIGLCPFHDEKTPSFTVSPTRNIFKCFGCGRGGSSVTFVMEHEGHSYPEALRWLARKYQIELEETAVSEEYEEQKQERESLIIINEFARDFFSKQLMESDTGKSVGLGYLKERGLILKTIQKFELGFISHGKDALTTAAVQAGYNIELLRKLGLTTKNDRDFFFERIIFPIHDLSGKVVAFAGRQLKTNKKSPKYVNSKESEIYNKSKVLYGLHLAKKAIRKEDICILVEGYTDVLALVQSSIENVVASSGTALTIDQIKLVKRYTNNVQILFDGDPAGIKAALRGIDLILEQDLNVQIVLLPEDEDPDSYLKKVGATAFQTYLDEQSKDFILFKTSLILDEAGSDPVKKAGLIKDIIDSLAHIPDPIKRSVYVKQCSNLLEVDENILISETNKEISKKMRNRRIDKLREARTDHDLASQQIDSQQGKGQTYHLETPQATDEYQERDIARILILHGNQIIEKEPEAITVAEYILSNIQETVTAFDNSLYAQIVSEYGLNLAEKKKLDTNYFINHKNPDIAQLAVEFCASPYEYSANWEKMWDVYLQTQPKPEDNIVNDSYQSLLRFMLRKLQKMSDENLSKVKQCQASNDQEELSKHLQVQHMLIQKRNEVAQKLNTVIL